MGQKVHPNGLRLGVITNWASRWFAKSKKAFSSYLIEDVKVVNYIKKKLYISGVSRVEIERAANKIKVTVYTAKPGIVIGKGGAGIEDLRKEVEALTQKSTIINITEIKNPELDAQLAAEAVALQLERRVSFRRAMKQAITRSMRQGVQGIKIAASGRLGGAEIARTEHYMEGKVPLHTLRAHIDYGIAEAHTTYGIIGIKVWIYKGEVLPASDKQERRGGI